jgi:hypothetical protein
MTYEPETLLNLHRRDLPDVATELEASTDKHDQTIAWVLRAVVEDRVRDCHRLAFLRTLMDADIADRQRDITNLRNATYGATS